MSTEQLNQLLKQAEELSVEEKLLLAKRLIEQAQSAQASDNNSKNPLQPIDRSKRHLSLEWLKQHQGEYAGRYVALDGDLFLADGATYQEAALAAKKSYSQIPFIVHLPSPNTTYFAGW